MAYAIIINVQAPVEMHDAVHAEAMKQTDGSVDGLLVHVGRATRDGFQVIEVWASKEDHDRYNEELIQPVIARAAAGQSGPPPVQTIEEFDVRGLVIPQVRVVM
jgi:hypothetical protein